MTSTRGDALSRMRGTAPSPAGPRAERGGGRRCHLLADRRERRGLHCRVRWGHLGRWAGGSAISRLYGPAIADRRAVSAGHRGLPARGSPALFLNVSRSTCSGDARAGVRQPALQRPSSSSRCWPAPSGPCCSVPTALTVGASGAIFGMMAAPCGGQAQRRHQPIQTGWASGSSSTCFHLHVPGISIGGHIGGCGGTAVGVADVRPRDRFACPRAVLLLLARRPRSPPWWPASLCGRQRRLAQQPFVGLLRRSSEGFAWEACGHAAAAAAPMRRARRGRWPARPSAAANAFGSPGSTSRPVSPSASISGRPPCAAATTGLPAAAASMRRVGAGVRPGRGHAHGVGRPKHRLDVAVEAEDVQPPRPSRAASAFSSPDAAPHPGTGLPRPARPRRSRSGGSARARASTSCPFQALIRPSRATAKASSVDAERGAAASGSPRAGTLHRPSGTTSERESWVRARRTRRERVRALEPPPVSGARPAPAPIDLADVLDRGSPPVGRRAGPQGSPTCWRDRPGAVLAPSRPEPDCAS